MIDIRQYARQLGGEVAGRSAVICPGPGHSPKDRSLSVRFDAFAPNRDGFIVFSHAGDDPLRCRDYVRERLQIARNRFQNAMPALREPTRAPAEDQADRTLIALRIWESANPIGTSLAATHLASRKIDPGTASSDVIRFHGALRFNGGTTPGMVSLLRDIRTNEPCGIHRTFLDARGQKIGRKMLGRARGAAIKLDADEDVTAGLTIGEGVETCLAARQLGFSPAWALGSAGAIESFPNLPGIETLTILAETDDNGANERATEVCATRWQTAGAEVITVKPEHGGDMNDQLMGGCQ